MRWLGRATCHASSPPLDPVRQIPGVAIVSSAMLVWVLTVSGTFVYLATFSAIARLLMYASTCAALIVFRRRDGPAPIPIPLGPLWGVLALACSLLALGTTTGTAVRDVSIAIGLGLAGRTAARLWNRAAGRGVVNGRCDTGALVPLEPAGLDVPAGTLAALRASALHPSSFVLRPSSVAIARCHCVFLRRNLKPGIGRVQRRRLLNRARSRARRPARRGARAPRIELIPGGG